IRNIIIVVVLLQSFNKISAQISMPDTVCAGTTKTYSVNNPNVPSTYTWKIDGVTQSATTNTITIPWNTTGVFTLTVQEHSTTGCDGDIQSGQVLVKSKLQPLRYPTVTTNANVATQLLARSIGNNNQYHWSPPTGLNFTSVTNPVFKFQ